MSIKLNDIFKSTFRFIIIYSYYINQYICQRIRLDFYVSRVLDKNRKSRCRIFLSCALIDAM